jgi:hypothetical protein
MAVAQATTTTTKKGFASIALGASRSDSETKQNAKVVGSAKSEPISFFQKSDPTERYSDRV